MRVLTVNAGSSSLKLRALAADDSVLAERELDSERGVFSEGEVGEAIAAMPEVDAIAHRFVHGGSFYTAAVQVKGDVEKNLRSLVELAPLHQPAALAGLDAVRKHLPGLPEIACFDTAFHSGMPEEAATYAVPAEWRQRHGVRRFGFHGLSHAYASRKAAELAGRPLEELLIVTCHLGAGASLAAVRGGSSIDTTMGFTPQEGLVMATRAGSIDPGMLLWLQTARGFQAADLADALEHGSGLLALAGTPDMRSVLEAEARDEEAARLAVAVYLRSLRTGIAAMAAALGGLDVLAFTGGVGENAASIRDRAVAGLPFLRPQVFTMRAREDLQMAAETRALLGS